MTGSLFPSKYANYVIFVYAFSFLIMFAAIISQRRRAAHSDLLDSFYVLAFFGLFHALSDFTPLLWNLLHLPKTYMTTFSYVKLGLSILSFQFLLYFAFMMLTKPEKRIRWFVYLSPLVIGVHYVIGTNLYARPASPWNYLAWLLAFPSSVLAAAAFLALSRRLQSLHLTSLMWDSRILALALLAYGFLKIPRAFTTLETTTAAMPILVLRAIAVVVITTFVLRILTIFRVQPPETESSLEPVVSKP